jgi:hypothetical protein
VSLAARLVGQPTRKMTHSHCGTPGEPAFPPSSRRGRMPVMSNDKNDDGTPKEPSARPTAIHYAFVVSLCLIVVTSLSWLLSYKNVKALRAQNEKLRNEISILKASVADHKNRADKEQDEERENP